MIFCFVECHDALDVGVIIDASDSVDYGTEYGTCLKFVANITKFFKVSEQGTHFGAIVYSSTAKLQFNFANANYYNNERLQEAITNFHWLGSGTRTDLALELANTDLFSSKGGDRPSKPNVLFVITDGRTHPLSKKYPEVLKPLQVIIATILILRPC